jgi:hypothetical protein
MCRGTGEINDKWNPKPKKSFNPKKNGKCDHVRESSIQAWNARN